MRSKHKKAQHFARTGLFTNLKNFVELENRIAKLPEYDRGNAFEVFAEAYFNTLAIILAQEVWPDNAIPQSIRSQLGLPPCDMGIDGIIKTHNDEYHAYQVKYRSNRPSLPWAELATFAGLSDKTDHRILFTNCNEITSVMHDRTNFNSIRGVDLDGLAASDFKTIEQWLTTGEIKREKKSPMAHQTDVIQDTLQELSLHDRTTVIMACGTGKTLTALWVAEKIEAQTILVLLPSLALVRQTLQDWSKEHSWDTFNYICVCSDTTVAKDEDEIILNQHDLPFSVTTQKDDIEQYLQSSKNSLKIVFSTYQSSQIVAEAMPYHFAFDLAIFDEAHKTASRQGANYAFALQDKNLSIKKRLFLTATPRHYNVAKKDKDGEHALVYSMDDQAAYGRIAHELTFRSAVEKGLICDYKVIISIVTSEMITRELLKQGEVVVHGDIIKAQRIANILAVQNAIEKYNVKRIFSFHSSVKSAQSFTVHSAEGIGAYLKDFTTLHVNGVMATSKREMILKEFEEADKAIISNARCLTEGVNVPVVDMVAFISPKKSKVDIVQAAGRAMRKSQGKEIGYILIPVFVQTTENETIEQALEKTKFDTVWDVLHAMQEQDKSLVEIIDQMREDLGRTLGYNDNRLREKIEILGPEICINELRKAITTNIIERLGSNWDEKFGELVAYKNEHGHCNVPDKDPKNKQLAIWVGTQRQAYKKNQLDSDKKAKLEDLGFVWDPFNSAWNKMFAELQAYKNEHGHCNVPRDSKNKQLAIWVGKQRARYKKNILDADKKAKLESLGFDWDPFNSYWDKMFAELQAYKNEHGHCNVPRDSKNKQLAYWVKGQRQAYKKNILDSDKKAKLEDLDFDWDPINSYWDKMFAELQAYKNEHSHCNVPQQYPKNKQLATWVTVQRQAYKKNILDADKKAKLEGLGFDWDPINSYWNKMFVELQAFKNEHGHCNVPRDSKNKQLATWIGTQRQAYKNNTLDTDKKAKLESLGFDWDPINSYWNKMFAEFITFKNEHSHCNVPQQYPKNKQLATWVNKQRQAYKKNILDANKKAKLESLGFDWDPINSYWDKMFAELQAYKNEHGHWNVPRDSKNKQLATWVGKQRHAYKKNQLDSDKKAKLEALGFDWDPINSYWNKMFAELQAYNKEHGHCNVPSTYHNKSLATWVVRQRKAYKKNTLDSDKKVKLEDLGFNWDPFNSDWDKMFAELITYKNEHGHCNVSGKDSKNKQLAAWIGTQRQAYKKNRLSQDQIKKLEAIKFK